MAVIAPADITWELSSDAWKFVHDQSQDFLDNYLDIKSAFTTIVSEYINAVANCDHKGLGISPLGGTNDGGKLFKIRLPVPGKGKSGGLRVHFVAYCATKKVTVLTADMRKDC